MSRLFIGYISRIRSAARGFLTSPRVAITNRFAAVCCAVVFSAALPARASQPDLQIQGSVAVVNPLSIQTGTPFSIGFNVVNSVPGTTSKATTVNVRLSQSSSAPSTSDYLLGSASIPALTSTSKPFTVTLNPIIPASYAAGRAYVWIILDPNSVAGQSSAAEANDRLSALITIVKPLATTSSSSASPGGGAGGGTGGTAPPASTGTTAAGASRPTLVFGTTLAGTSPGPTLSTAPSVQWAPGSAIIGLDVRNVTIGELEFSLAGSRSSGTVTLPDSCSKPGRYTVTLYSGGVVVATGYYTVDVSTPLPTVALASISSATAGKPIAISASTNATGVVSWRVEATADGSTWATALSASGTSKFTTSLTLTKATATAKFRVTVTDSKSQSASATSNVFTVLPGAPATARLTSGALPSCRPGDPLSLTVEVDDAFGNATPNVTVPVGDPLLLMSRLMTSDQKGIVRFDWNGDQTNVAGPGIYAASVTTNGRTQFIAFTILFGKTYAIPGLSIPLLMSNSTPALVKHGTIGTAIRLLPADMQAALRATYDVQSAAITDFIKSWTTSPTGGSFLLTVAVCGVSSLAGGPLDPLADLSCGAVLVMSEAALSSAAQQLTVSEVKAVIAHYSAQAEAWKTMIDGGVLVLSAFEIKPDEGPVAFWRDIADLSKSGKDYTEDVVKLSNGQTEGRFQITDSRNSCRYAFVVRVIPRSSFPGSTMAPTNQSPVGSTVSAPSTPTGPSNQRNSVAPGTRQFDSTSAPTSMWNVLVETAVAAKGSVVVTVGSQGKGIRQAVVRAVGPGGGIYGQSSGVSKPHISVYDGQGHLVADASAGSATSANLNAAYEGAGMIPGANGDAAVITSISGIASVSEVVSDDSGRGGNVVLETGLTSPSLATTGLYSVGLNAHVPAGGHVLVGFNLVGASMRTIVARAVGPGGGMYRLTTPINKPHVLIQDAAGKTLADGAPNSAGASAIATAFRAAGLPGTGSQDAAVAPVLTAGTYVAVIKNDSGSEGDVRVDVAVATATAQ